MDDICALCDPPGLNDDSDSMVVKTVNRWVQMGVFRELEGMVDLGTDLKGVELFSKDDVLLEAFRWGVLKSLLRTSVEPIQDSPAGDFIIAAWWLLQLDPVGICLDSDEAAVQESGRSFPGKTVIQNDTRWQGLLEWVAFLGLGTSLKGALIPNPTAALRWALAEQAFSPGESHPALDFIEAVEAQISLFGHGAAARAVATYFQTSPGRGGSRYTVQPALSMALMSLRGQGLLKFEGREDSQSMVLLEQPGGGTVRLERVTIVER